MPQYQVKKSDGSIVDMPWAGSFPPNSHDIDKFLGEGEDTRGIASKVWDFANKPMVDYSPKMREAMDEFSTEHPIAGGAGKFLADTVVSGTSPLSVGLEAATAGGSLAARLPRVANIANKVKKTASAGMAVHGAYKVGEGIYKGDLPTVTAGALEGIGGIAGYRSATHKPIVAQMPPSIQKNPTLSNRMAPPESILTTKERLALPPAPSKPRFYSDGKGLVVDSATTPEPIINAAYGNPPEVQPRGDNLNVGEFKESQRVNKLDYSGMTPEKWARIADGTEPAQINGRGESRPTLATGDRSMGFDPETTKSMGYPYDIVPNSLRPRVVQNVTDRLVPDRMKGVSEVASPETITPEIKPVKAPAKIGAKVAAKVKKLVSNETGAVGNQDVYFHNPTPETIVKMRSKGYTLGNTDSTGVTTFTYSQPKPITTPTLNEVPPKPTTPNVKQGLGESKTIADKPILDPAEGVKRVREWNWKSSSAKVRGSLESKKFSDLSDPSLIDKYELGDRSGRLKELQDYFDAKHKEGSSLGILGEEQYVPNYLRHEYQQNPEEVANALRTFTARNPSLAKQREFKTYSQAEAIGLTRKFKDIPEIVDAYETKFGKAKSTKELYDYLDKSGHIKPGSVFTNDPKSWNIKSPEVSDALHKALTPADSLQQKLGNASSFMKNIYLAGGIPGTKYNMHAVNTAVSDAKLGGFYKAASEFFTDPTGAKAKEYLTQNEHLIPTLMDHGYVYHPVEDLSVSAGKGVLGKVIDTTQAAFEKPLFERSLPALKLKRTLDTIEQLGGMENPEAVKAGVEMGNKFYGGMTDNLKLSKSNQALSRAIFLAPDWYHSRLAVAKGDLIGAAKVLAPGKFGKASLTDVMHAKSAARGGIVAGGTLLAKHYLSSGKQDILKDKPGDALSIPLFKDGKKTASLSPLGTSDELMKIPIETAIKAYQGDYDGLIQALVGNKMGTPIKAVINIAVRGQDDFGNNLAGKDKFGRSIPAKKALFNILNELTKPAQYQVIQAAIKAAQGDASWKEVLSTGAELPIKFSNDPKSKTRRTPPSVRLPR